MISFYQFLSEIAVDFDLVDKISGKKLKPTRFGSKLTPQTDIFNIIPIKISYAIYNVFKRYISPKYALADQLLNRRGDSVSIVTVKASNEELANLRELANHIEKYAPEKMPNRPEYANQEREIAVAKIAIKEIDDAINAAGSYSQI